MLDKKKKYLQIALNSTLSQAKQIINQLPASERIIIEAGTPLLKQEGATAIKQIKSWWTQKLLSLAALNRFKTSPLATLNPIPDYQNQALKPYLIADYKAMDRGHREAQIAAAAGADAITVLGQAPTATIDQLIEAARQAQIQAIVDMMNVDRPHQVLRRLKKLPDVVMLHRGVDETEHGNTPFPIHLINKVKGSYDVIIAVGGGDTIREVQSAFFNGANIVMVWQKFYQSQDNTADIAAEFLKQVK